MEIINKLTEKEIIILETKREVYNDIYDKVSDIHSGDIEANYYLVEIERELEKIAKKLKEPELPEKVEILAPEFGPGNEVFYKTINTEMLFKVMEVNYKTQEYKLTSKNQIKPITIIVGWSELDKTL